MPESLRDQVLAAVQAEPESAGVIIAAGSPIRCLAFRPPAPDGSAALVVLGIDQPITPQQPDRALLKKAAEAAEAARVA